MPTITERIVMCEQGSAEWFAARCGCVGSSTVDDAIAKLKRKQEESAARYSLRFALVGERLTGDTADHFVSKWMKEGKEKEPLARAEYEMRFGLSVEQVGLVYHPTIKWAESSPDGMVGDDGLIEIKCPKVETHLEYIVQDTIPDEYLPQMTWQLACCDDRKWSDFVSYAPSLPEDLQIFRKRLERTEQVNAVIRGMELEVIAFLAEVDAMVKSLSLIGKP